MKNRGRIFSEIQEKHIIKLYVDDKLSIYDIAKKYRCYRTVIVNVLKRVKVYKKNYPAGESPFSPEQEKQIVHLYVKRRISSLKIAKQFNCSYPLISRILKRNGVIMRDASENSRIFTDEQEKEICRMYTEDELSTADISKKMKCCPKQVRIVLAKYDVESRTISEGMEAGHYKELKDQLQKVGYRFTAVRRNKILAALRLGMPPVAAAGAAKISGVTLRNWINDAKEKGEKSFYYNFYLTYLEAISIGTYHLFTKMKESKGMEWKKYQTFITMTREDFNDKKILLKGGENVGKSAAIIAAAVEAAKRQNDKKNK